MSFIYPRKVEIRRPISDSTTEQAPVVGRAPYGGLASNESQATVGGEIVIFKNIPCSIQIRTIYVSRGERMLPSNATNQQTWRIFIPKTAVAKGLIRDHDVAVDDEGYRYDVTPYWNSLGHRLECVRLES